MSKLTDVWLDEFTVKGLCGLCGNTGNIDTRNRVYSPAGVECGGQFFCICPNGRALAKAKRKQEKKNEQGNSV